MGSTALPAPMHRALELAWESFRAGSLGIGAVVTHGDEIVATGRNRLAESDPGDDALAGTSLAHAEINALAKLRWGVDPGGLELWTTLQPCLQCLGAIRLSPVQRVHVLAPDPFFRGVEAVRDINEFIASGWHEVIDYEINEWSVLSLLFETHVFAFWGAGPPGWHEALPDITALARKLIASGELLDLASADVGIDEVVTVLSERLDTCVPEVFSIRSPVDP